MTAISADSAPAHVVSFPVLSKVHINLPICLNMSQYVSSQELNGLDLVIPRLDFDFSNCRLFQQDLAPLAALRQPPKYLQRQIIKFI